MMQGRQFDISKVDRSCLRDINSVVIDTTLSRSERLKKYIEQIGNPYCYLDKGTVVSISYADTSVSLEDRLKSYVASLG